MDKLLVILSFVLLASCSNTTSTIVENKSIDGLTYFMPSKDFIVTIKMTEPDKDGVNEVSDISFTVSKAYADRSKQYVLQHGTNWLNDNKLEVSVDTNGLLKSSKSTSISKVGEVFEGIATTAGYKSLINTDFLCKKAGEYVFLFNPKNYSTPIKKCGVTIRISPLPKSLGPINSHIKKSDSDYSGVFYRQEEAYKIKAETDNHGINKEAILSSPSGSEILFLPISKSLFGDSVATLDFTDGMPTAYTQDDQSEFVGAFAIPAKVIGAYFKAAGELFSAFSTKNTNESALIKSESALELEKHKSQRDLELSKIESDYKFKLAELKVQACESAVADNNKTLINSLGCGK